MPPTPPRMPMPDSPPIELTDKQQQPPAPMMPPLPKVQEIPTYVMHPKGMPEPRDEPEKPKPAPPKEPEKPKPMPLPPIKPPTLTPLENPEVPTYVMHQKGKPIPEEIKPKEPEGKHACWRQASSRGNGTNTACAENQELGFNGCFSKCDEGYTG